MRSSPKKEKENESVYFIDSISAIRDFLRLKSSSVMKITCNQKSYEKIEDLLVGSRVSVKVYSDQELKELKLKPIQADVVVTPITEKSFLERIVDRKKDVILLLDHITDPRNLGAIARNSAFFGIKEIIVAKNRQVLLTGASISTSQGAFALTDLVQVTNLSRTIDKLKKNGYWIVGCEKGGENIESVSGLYEKVVIILGSEDKGLSRLVREKCDIFVGIEGVEQTLGSLNVSVACGIILRAFQIAQKNIISGMKS